MSVDRVAESGDGPYQSVVLTCLGVHLQWERSTSVGLEMCGFFF